MSANLDTNVLISEIEMHKNRISILEQLIEQQKFESELGNESDSDESNSDESNSDDEYEESEVSSGIALLVFQVWVVVDGNDDQLSQFAGLIWDLANEVTIENINKLDLFLSNNRDLIKFRDKDYISSSVHPIIYYFLCYQLKQRDATSDQFANLYEKSKQFFGADHPISKRILLRVSPDDMDVLKELADLGFVYAMNNLAFRYSNRENNEAALKYYIKAVKLGNKVALEGMLITLLVNADDFDNFKNILDEHQPFDFSLFRDIDFNQLYLRFIDENTKEIASKYIKYFGLESVMASVQKEHIKANETLSKLNKKKTFLMEQKLVLLDDVDEIQSYESDKDEYLQIASEGNLIQATKILLENFTYSNKTLEKCLKLSRNEEILSLLKEHLTH